MNTSVAYNFRYEVVNIVADLKRIKKTQDVVDAVVKVVKPKRLIIHTEDDTVTVNTDDTTTMYYIIKAFSEIFPGAEETLSIVTKVKADAFTPNSQLSFHTDLINIAEKESAYITITDGEKEDECDITLESYAGSLSNAFKHIITYLVTNQHKFSGESNE